MKKKFYKIETRASLEHKLATSGPTSLEVDESPNLLGPHVLSDEPVAALKDQRNI
jgi:hypothetical protein